MTAEEREEERRRKAEQAAHAAAARQYWSAESLPETHMSRFLQALVRARLRELGDTELSTSTEKAAAAEQEQANSVTVRVVSSVLRSFDVHRAVRACFGLPNDAPAAGAQAQGEDQEDENDDMVSTVTTQVPGSGSAGAVASVSASASAAADGGEASSSSSSSSLAQIPKQVRGFEDTYTRIHSTPHGHRSFTTHLPDPCPTNNRCGTRARRCSSSSASTAATSASSACTSTAPSPC
jgi:hypothetical protein